jgi:hypothetical protein
MRIAIAVAVFVVCGAGASPAWAQRFPFERPFDVTERATLDVSTIRGKIDVTIGEPGQIVVSGAATVRIGWRTLADAAERARMVAANPPVRRDGHTIRLTPPADEADRDAMTVNYQVRVPPASDVLTASDSGATTVRGVTGRVTVRTQSGAIEVGSLGGTTMVTTGSGAVIVNGSAGALSVTTSSSAFSGRSLGGHVHVRTQSGAVDASLTGDGNVDIETGSSEIRVRGARGGVKTLTQSGRTFVDGLAGRPWDITTGSGSVETTIDHAQGFKVHATTGGGSVRVEGATVQGTVGKRNVTGTIGPAGSDSPLVRINSRSGSILLTVGRRRSARLQPRPTDTLSARLKPRATAAPVQPRPTDTLSARLKPRATAARVQPRPTDTVSVG